MNTTNLLIKITHHADISKPDFVKSENALVITSPADITLAKRSDAWIDLKLNVEFKSPNHSLWLKLSTVFGSIGFDICDKDNWINNKTKENTIALHLFNRSFYNDINIKKGDVIGFAFLLGGFLSLNIEYKIKNN